MARLSLPTLTSLALAATPAEAVQNQHILASLQGANLEQASTFIDMFPTYWDPEDTALIDALLEINTEKIFSSMLKKQVISARLALQYAQSGKIKITESMGKKLFNYLKRQDMSSDDAQELMNLVLKKPSISLVRDILIEYSEKLTTTQAKRCMDIFAEKRGIVIIPWAVQYDYCPTTLISLSSHAWVHPWMHIQGRGASENKGPVAYNAREVLRHAYELFKRGPSLPATPNYLEREEGKMLTNYEEEKLLAHTHMWDHQTYRLTPEHRYKLATSTSSKEVGTILKRLDSLRVARQHYVMLPELEMNPHLVDILTSKDMAKRVLTWCPTWPVLNAIEKKFGDYAVQLVNEPLRGDYSLDVVPSSVSTIIRYPSKNLIKRLGPNSKMYGSQTSGALSKATLRVYSNDLKSNSKENWMALHDLLKNWEGTHGELLDTVSALG